MKIIARIALIFVAISSLLCSGALAATIEQIQICMPKIDVYMYGDGSDLSNFTESGIIATLDGEPLTVEEFRRSEQGIFYVYMLDVSASMPEGHFNAAKQAILDAWSRLRDQDSLALITFGNEVTLQLEGGESRTEVTEKLDSLQNSDNNTKFYNAMDALIGLVLQTEDMRRVAVVISDGIDDTDAGMTQEELEAKLINTGVSVSALCIDTVSEDIVKKFAGFIRLSGGELYVFGASDAGTVMDSLLDRLDGGWLLELEAPTNIASGEEAVLNIDFGGETTMQISVRPERWKPDEKPPRVKSVEFSEENNAFTVTFSEAVTGADDTASYALTDDAGKAFALSAIEKGEGTSYRLILAEPLPDKATVTLAISGITDVSMEQNALKDYSEAVWPETAAPAENGEAAQPAPDEPPLIDAGTIVLIVALILIVVVAIMFLVKLSAQKTGDGKKKEPKKQKDKPDSVKSTATFMFLDGEDEEKKK